MDFYLGLDIGTTNCKVVAVDRQGQISASASARTPVCKSSDNGIAEYDAKMLWKVGARLVRQVVEKLGSVQNVAGLAVASMGESGVLVDKAGSPLASIPTWYDHRTQPWTGWWRERLTETEIYDITGLPLDYLYSVNKILWLRENGPEAFSRAFSYLCVADWITYCLTGQFSTSYSMASRTMLFDIHQQSWSETMLRLSDLAADLMPTALPSGILAGKVNRLAEQATGLQEGLPVFTGGHDHICAAIAAGAIEPGIVLDSAGTAEALMVTLETPISGDGMPASGLCCGCHTVRDRYYLLGGLMGGGVLAWVSRLLTGDDSPRTINRLMDEAASSPPGANGVQFLPYLDGSGPPDRAPTAWGAWLGLSLKHTRSDMVRAAVEGLSYGIRYLLEISQTRTNVSVGELRCVGGGSRNGFWQQIKTDVLGLSVDTPTVTDVTAQGAALLAAVGAQVFRDEVEASRVAYRSGMRYEIQPEHSAFYNDAYQQEYQKNYRVHKPNQPQGV
ncbi:MAG: FGGY family carbohydrate kinase [Anaerolineales bacterium]|jgi:xylulokinase